MTVNFKGNVWELQLSNAVFCHFLFSVNVNLTVPGYIFLLLHYWDILTAVFLLCICLCLGHPQRPNLELKNTRGKGLKHKGSLSARVTFVPIFSLEV